MDSIMLKALMHSQLLCWIQQIYELVSSDDYKDLIKNLEGGKKLYVWNGKRTDLYSMIR